MSNNVNTIPHPAETGNRRNLAVEIVRFLDENPGLFAAGKPTAFGVEQFGPDLWDNINAHLGRDRVISPMTVALVIGILVGREI